MAKHPRDPVEEARRRQPAAPPVNEEPAGELDFSDQPKQRFGRAGDLRPAEEVARELPPSRERQAGRSGGEIAGGDLTADDVSPETLLDESPSHNPDSLAERDPADKVLRRAEEDEIGEGRGLDEAELAYKDPVGRR